MYCQPFSFGASTLICPAAYCVYEVYSWDVMEPASYFLMVRYSTIDHFPANLTSGCSSRGSRHYMFNYVYFQRSGCRSMTASFTPTPCPPFVVTRPRTHTVVFCW